MLFGTKDNKLAVLNTSAAAAAADACRVIKLPERLDETSPVRHPIAMRRPLTSPAAATEHPLNVLLRRHMAGRRHVRFQGTLEQAADEPVIENCGIHAIAINPSGTRMVTGGANPSDCAVFSVPDLRPTALLTGHKDWIFGLDWITDNIVASGSRDKTVKLWCVPDAPCDASNTATGSLYRQLSSPLSTFDSHADRVRDLRYCRDVKRLASMSTDGRVFFADPETSTTVEERRLRGKKELVCLATDGSLLVAGSQQHISIMDHRVGTVVRDERLVGNSCDGVRSISFSGNGRMLTCGGGGGKITFYDMRMGQFLPATRACDVDADIDQHHADSFFGRVYDDKEKEETDAAAAAAAASEDSQPAFADVNHVTSSPLRHHHLGPRPDSPTRGADGNGPNDALSFQIGEGFLDRQHHIYLDHFANGNVLNACYAHAWDATGTRLMVAGGPLAYGLRGCYVGVWR